MAGSFRTNYVIADPASESAWQLLCSWDFSVTNERAVRQRKNNLCVQLKVPVTVFVIKCVVITKIQYSRNLLNLQIPIWKCTFVAVNNQINSFYI